jgi:cytochrome P450
MRRFHKKNPQYLEANKVCRAYVDTFVEEVMSMKKSGIENVTIPNSGAKPGRESLLKHMAIDTDDKEKIRGELLSLLLAGRDTSGSLLSNLIDAFSRRPDVWHKVQEEVKQLGGEIPTYTQLRNLKYIKYCVNEGESWAAFCGTIQANSRQRFVCTLPWPSVRKPQCVTQFSHVEGVLMARHQYSSLRVAK